MDEEKIETTELEQEVQQETIKETKKIDFKRVDLKKLNLKELDYKKYLPYVGIALVVIIVLIVLVSALGGGPKKAVKKFISGMSNQKASKIIKNMDFIGSSAWSYYYDENDFSEDDYDEFIENYEKYEEKYEDEVEAEIDDMQDYMDEYFEEIDDEYKSYKVKIEKFKDVEKLGKNLYAVDVKISMEAKPKDKDETDEIDESETVTFIVYKNKVIYADGIL